MVIPLLIRVISTLSILAGIVFMARSVLSAKRLARFSLISWLLIGAIGISFGAMGLFRSPSAESCFLFYVGLVFLFFGTSLILFLRGGEANESS